ncbi:hypothetical protein FRC00_002311 [Tulasnella sp. 408]|nr:hypothetical protein FRC00_002311 [Tulasnella sp. 408]
MTQNLNTTPIDPKFYSGPLADRHDPSKCPLFQPLKIGNAELSHRIVLAPLSRFRADSTHVHREIAQEYYGQRVTKGGFIISEATFVSEELVGLRHAPGIYSDEQIAAWKTIVSQIHDQGGYIFLQLWATGRGGDPAVHDELGTRFSAPSPVAFPREANEYEESNDRVPEEMTREDIKRVIREFATAAKNAVEQAGFDGVEIHGANGYLVDEFIQSVSNQRTDEYGGSIENRARFPLEVIQAVAEAVGQDRTAIRFSPYSTFLGMRMPDPVPQFAYLTRELRDRYPDMAYIHFIEGRVHGNLDVASTVPETSDVFREIWQEKDKERGKQSVFLSAGGWSPESAARVVREKGGAVAFGRAFIGNPDLVHRIKHGLPLNAYERATFYGPQGPTGRQGYTDYPFARPAKDDL